MRQWLEKQLEDQEYEVGREDAVDEMFLSSITPGSALVGGLVIGLVVGMVAMSYGPLDGSTGATPSQVEQAVQEYADSVSRTGRVESAEVESVTRRNGMYFANITVEASLLNTTRTSQAGMYVSPDGQVLFPTAIDIDQAVQQMQQPGPVNGTAS